MKVGDLVRFSEQKKGTGFWWAYEEDIGIILKHKVKCEAAWEMLCENEFMTELFMLNEHHRYGRFVRWKSVWVETYFEVVS